MTCIIRLMQNTGVSSGWGGSVGVGGGGGGGIEKG